MLRKLLAGILLVFLASSTQASHIAGATFKVVNLGGNSYEVSLVFYRDCSGIPAPSSALISFGSASNPSFGFTSSLPKTNVNTNIISTCASAPNSCQGGQVFGVEEDVYKGIVTLPPASDWVISYTSCCRNPNNNISYPTNESFYVETTLNNLSAPSNQIPVFKQHPRFVSYVSQLEIFDYSVTDLDGDSIAYSLITPLSGPTTTLTYLPGFSSTQPMSSNPPAGFNATTGEMSFTPTMNQTAVIAVKVEEWRNINGVNTLISTNMVDHEIFMVTGSNHAPVLGGLDTTMVHGYSLNDTLTSAIVIAGIPFQAALWGHDADPSSGPAPNEGTFNIRWDTAITAASFNAYNQDTDSAYAQFSWTPLQSDTGLVKCFSAVISDSACPYIGYNTFNYCFLVKDSGAVVLVASANGVNTNTICNHESIELRAPDGYDRYFWSTNETTQNIVLDSSDLNIGANTFSCLLRSGNFEYQAEITVYMDDCTGINDPDHSGLQVFPNPAAETITLIAENMNGNYNYTIINLNGKEVISAQNISNSRENINISELPEGLYIIEVFNHKKVLYRRFIKE